jgi:hypothetical protein
MNHKQVSCFLFLIGLFVAAFNPMSAPLQQTGDDASPPDHVVKLIFIHHSTGENWLTDGYGNLGETLGENNYFVSDTNYGWGHDLIGNRTDIPNWIEWFSSADTPTYMNELYNENGQHSSYTRTLSNPGGGNEIIMFKSCFPNSNLSGNPTDPPGTYAELSVGGAKYVYNEILQYFGAHPEKLFVVITAPPLQDGTYAANARAFNQWLINNWLQENHYTLPNVAVFDFYNILTSPGAHHRFYNGQVEHIVGTSNTLYYDSNGDDHPNPAGSQKATNEFVPLLNVFYHRFLSGREPGAFDKTNPLDNATGEQINLSLSWDASSGSSPVTSYQYCYDDQDNDLCDTSWVNNRLNRTANLSRLTPNTTYFWQARAVNNFGFIEADAGAWYSFTTDTSDTSTFLSAAANDGWVLESSEYASHANKRDNTGPLLVGDDVKNKQYRSLLYFDTASLPDNASLYNVRVRVMQADITLSDPFTTHGALLTDMAKGFFGRSGALENLDFHAKGVPRFNVGSFTSVSGEPGWYQLVLSPANFKYVNLKGVNQFRLRFARDDDNDKTADYVSFFSGDDGTNPPQLIVEYTIP